MSEIEFADRTLVALMAATLRPMARENKLAVRLAMELLDLVEKGPGEKEKGMWHFLHGKGSS